MTIKTANTATIETLNTRAAELANGVVGHDAYLAAMRAADEFGYRVADGDPNQGDCTALVNESGQHVNLWNNGQVSQRVEAGGIGFDDQIDWYAEHLSTDYEAV